MQEEDDGDLALASSTQGVATIQLNGTKASDLPQAEAHHQDKLEKGKDEARIESSAIKLDDGKEQHISESVERLAWLGANISR